MKKSVLLAAVTGIFAIFYSSFAGATVCTPGFVYPATSCSSGYSIAGFSVAGSSGSISDASACTGSGYADFFGTDSVHLMQAHTYMSTISFGSGYVSMNVQIWIDLNNNDVFESSESVGGANGVGAGAISLAIPLTATTGTHRMRVLVTESYGAAGSYPYLDPCATDYSYGEVRDYRATIVALPTCSGTPSAGTVSTTFSGIVCPSVSYTLNVSGVTFAVGVSLQWQSSPDSTTWTNISGATDSSITETETVTSFYRVKATCASSSLSSYSNAVKLNYSAICYCTPSFSDASYSCASYNFTIGLFKVFGNSSTSITDSNVCDGTGYEDRTALSCIFSPGTSYTVTIVTHNPSGSTYNVNNQIWIDFNDNGTFESSETVSGRNTYVDTSIQTIIIPAGTAAGIRRMRIVQVYFAGASWPDIGSCGGYGYGEARDYNVNIGGASGTFTPSSLAFGCTSVGSCSSPMAYNFTGNYLTPASGNITITAPTGYKVATAPGGTYVTSFSAAYTGGTISATYYAENCPSAATGYSGHILVSGGGLDTATYLPVTGSGCSTVCSGTPAGGTGSGTITAGCTGYTSVIAVSGASTGSGISYQWQSSADGATWTNVSGAIYNVYSATVSSAIYYRCKITCSAGGASAFSTSVHLTIITTTVSAITGTASVCTGSTTVLADATTGGSWSSSNPSVATVDGSGNVYGVGAGSVNISYSLTGACGTAIATRSVAVNSTPVIDAISGTSVCCTGSTTSLSDGTSGGTWSSASTSVATVNTSGLVRGVAAGTAVISYSLSNSCGLSAATLSVTVTSSVTAGAITGSATTVCAGATISFTDAISGGTWSSSNSAIATINSSGTVTGESGGSATISYNVTGGCGAAVATQNITVNPSASAGTVSGSSGICIGSSATLSESVSGGTWSSSNPSVATINSTGLVTAVSAGTATISYTVTGTGGCNGIAVFPVTTGTGGSVISGAITPGSASLCHASSVMLTISSSTTGLTYQWYKNGVLIGGATNATYSALAAGAYAAIISDGCGVDTIAAITVSGAPSPVIHLMGTDILYTGSYSSYQWYLNGVPITGATASTFTFTVPGVYKVNVSDSYGCYGLSTGYTVTSTGIEEVNTINDINIFPNPNSGIFTITVPIVQGSTIITIYDLPGKLLMTKSSGEQTIQLDMTGFPAGIYLVKVSAGGNVYNRKVIIR